MKNTFICLLILISIPLWSQEVQWGFRVLEYSSQKGSREFSAVQAIGAPNVMPAGAENIGAWQPKGNNTEEYIKVGFAYPLKPKQIIIAESFHPGYITKIILYDASGNEYEIASYLPKAIAEASRVLLINTSAVNFVVFAIKIVLKPENNLAIGIDAIGISESSTPYKIKVNSNDIIKSNMVAVRLDKNVNSFYPEIGPLVSADGKILYFSRADCPENVGGARDKEDIWYSTWDETLKTWGVAQNMGAPLNNKYPNFINSVSPDGNKILLGNSYLPDGSMDEGVSISRRLYAGWGIPQRLIIEDDNNNIGKRANYFLSNTQRTLLISNNRRKDTYGDRDLYVSFLKADKSWTKPLNLWLTMVIML